MPYFVNESVLTFCCLSRPQSLKIYTAGKNVYFVGLVMSCIVLSTYVSSDRYLSIHGGRQSELPRPIPRNSMESDHGCTSRIYFDIADDTVGTQRAYFELKYFKIVKMRDAKYSLKMAAEKWRQIFLF